METTSSRVFEDLSPDTILDGLAGAGFDPDGRISALNSYENRVYQAGVGDGSFVVAKFYRPGRWSDAAIVEEHRFTLELAERDVPVAAPLCAEDGTSLFYEGPFRFAVFPRVGGRPPATDDPETRRLLGRLVARLHNVGALAAFEHRERIDPEETCLGSADYLVEHRFVPAELEDAYLTLAEDLFERIEAAFARAGAVATLRLHGDGHPGNVLVRDDGPLLVDLDDCRTGPAIQDLWMFLSGDRQYMTRCLDDLLEGYTAFRDFDARELHLVEPLRTMRMMAYAAWIARRWDDGAFPRAFPWFDTPRYWDNHILELREQAALLDEPPLVCG